MTWDGSEKLSYEFIAKWDSDLPNSSSHTKVNLGTSLSENNVDQGGVVTMDVSLVNITSDPLPMATAVIGIPGGMASNNSHLKNLVDQNHCDYVEIFDNPLVLYWKEMKANATKNVAIPLVADFKGTFRAPASFAYLYYTDEDKHWIEGESVVIR